MADVTKDDLLKIYSDKILPMSIKGGTGKKETINIISDYTWNANSFAASKEGNNGSISFSHTVPLCYAIERRQTVNSSIANILNTLNVGFYATTDATHKISEAATKAFTSASENWSEQAQVAKNEMRDNGDGTKPATFTDAANSAVEGNFQQAGSQAVEAATNAVEQVKPAVLETAADAAGIISEGAKWLATNVRSLQSYYQEHLSKWSRIAKNNLNSDFLTPYSFLYFTEATEKSYVFPLLSSTDLLNVTNSYADAKTAEIPFFNGLPEFIKTGTEALMGVNNIINAFSDSQNIVTEEYHLEMAKAFNFNGDGQEVTSNFVLFNTIKKDAWKKHYRFLLTFLIRNLPFKVSPYSYVPPLLYDIIIPGTKHLPLCYVSNISIQSLGQIRNLRMDDFIKSSLGHTSPNVMNVSVPEAWNVSIKFKCLLSNTANLILDLKNNDINITVNSI